MGKNRVIEKTKEAVVLETPRGKKIVLLTPSGKCKRYKTEIESKTNHRGQPLNDVQIGYRMGYRAALGEQSKIYKRKNK